MCPKWTISATPDEHIRVTHTPIPFFGIVLHRDRDRGESPNEEENCSFQFPASEISMSSTRTSSRPRSKSKFWKVHRRGPCSGSSWPPRIDGHENQRRGAGASRSAFKFLPTTLSHDSQWMHLSDLKSRPVRSGRKFPVNAQYKCPVPGYWVLAQPHEGPVPG